MQGPKGPLLCCSPHTALAYCLMLVEASAWRVDTYGSPLHAR